MELKLEIGVLGRVQFRFPSPISLGVILEVDGLTHLG